MWKLNTYRENKTSMPCNFKKAALQINHALYFSVSMTTPQTYDCGSVEQLSRYTVPYIFLHLIFWKNNVGNISCGQQWVKNAYYCILPVKEVREKSTNGIEHHLKDRRLRSFAGATQCYYILWTPKLYRDNGESNEDMLRRKHLQQYILNHKPIL